MQLPVTSPPVALEETLGAALPPTRQRGVTPDRGPEENGATGPPSLEAALALEPNAELRAELAAELCATFPDPLAWLAEPDPLFGGRTPLEVIRLGHSDKVLSWVLTVQYGGVS